MSRGDRRRNGTKESQWRTVLGKFGASGLSVRAFCRKERLSEASFYAWRRELALRDREELAAGPRTPRPSSSRTASTKSPLTAARRRSASSAPTSFVPLTLTAAPTVRSAAAVEVALPTGELVRVPSGCDSATLQMVLAALRNSHGPALC